MGVHSLIYYLGCFTCSMALLQLPSRSCLHKIYVTPTNLLMLVPIFFMCCFGKVLFTQSLKPAGVFKCCQNCVIVCNQCSYMILVNLQIMLLLYLQLKVPAVRIECVLIDGTSLCNKSLYSFKHIQHRYTYND